MISLDFPIQFRYDDTSSGIIVPVEMIALNERVAFAARLDTGASDCLVDRSLGELLGIDIESGERAFIGLWLVPSPPMATK